MKINKVGNFKQFNKFVTIDLEVVEGINKYYVKQIYENIETGKIMVESMVKLGNKLLENYYLIGKSYNGKVYYRLYPPKKSSSEVFQEIKPVNDEVV